MNDADRSPPEDGRESETAERSDHDAPAREERQSRGEAGGGDREREAKDRDAKEKEAAQERRRARARPWVRAGMVVVLLGLIGGGVYYWWSTRGQIETDDAFTDGRAVTIAPHVNGYVVSLDVNDNQFVHRGDALIHIDPRDYEAQVQQARGQLDAALGQLAASQRAFEVAKVNFPARLQQAEASLKDANANLFKAQTDYRRQQSLPRPATTQQQVDYATAALRSAEAQVAQAQAQVQQAMPVQPNIQQTGAQVTQLQGSLEQARASMAQAELNLSWTVVRAPQDGWVTKRNVEQGNYVQSGQQIFSIVTPDVWITANFKETQLNRMRPGQPVEIAVDSYPGLHLRGHVDSVQLGSGSKFTAFPPENATGNFVKIVQRVPVKIVIDEGLDPNLPLPLGISVEPTVHVQ
jgi:membrane fusion protein, multidrug efflux system